PVNTACLAPSEPSTSLSASMWIGAEGSALKAPSLLSGRVRPPCCVAPRPEPGTTLPQCGPEDAGSARRLSPRAREVTRAPPLHDLPLSSLPLARHPVDLYHHSTGTWPRRWRARLSFR